MTLTEQLEADLGQAIKERDEAQAAWKQFARTARQMELERDEARANFNDACDANVQISLERDWEIKKRAEAERLAAELRNDLPRAQQRLKAEHDNERLQQNANDRISAQLEHTIDQRNHAQSLVAELKNELNHALAELHMLRANTTPELSRLEIAARIMQGMLSVGGWDSSVLVGVALQYTDELIARAKEVQP